MLFDSPSTFGGTSFKKDLLQGQGLTNNLLGVLFRFRQGLIAFFTNVAGMFFQVQLAKEDVNFQQFLWWLDGDITKNLKEHRMVVHIFGAVSSLSCTTFA